MQNSLILKLYKNSRGVSVGDLYRGTERILATTHPATIAASMYSMDEYSFIFSSNKGFGEFAFPIDTGELDALGYLVEDLEDGNFMSGFATFSRVDFASPGPRDTQADIHFRVATHHINRNLLKVLPAKPQPKSFKKDLKARNRFIYFPWC